MVFIWNTKGMLNVWSIIKSHFKKQLRHSTSLRFTVFIRLVRDIDVFLLGCYFVCFDNDFFFLSIFFIKIFYFTMLGSNFKLSNIYIYISLHNVSIKQREHYIYKYNIYISLKDIY